MGSLADEQVPLPKVEEIDFEAKLSGTLDDVLKAASQLPFYSSRMSGSSVIMARVESRNINKKPYLFHIITIKPDGLTLAYSVPQDSSVTLRRAEALKNLTGIASILYPTYQLSQVKFLHYMDSVIDSMVSGMSQNYNVLFNKYDSLISEYRDTKRLNLELSSSNRTLTIKTAELNEDNKSLREQLSALQKFSDESLMVLIEEWLQVHNNAIDIEEFSKTYSISMQRIEQILDKMVSMGYIELKA